MLKHRNMETLVIIRGIYRRKTIMVKPLYKGVSMARKKFSSSRRSYGENKAQNNYFIWPESPYTGGVLEKLVFIFL